jgi:hypothetical protein
MKNIQEPEKTKAKIQELAVNSQKWERDSIVRQVRTHTHTHNMQQSNKNLIQSTYCKTYFSLSRFIWSLFFFFFPCFQWVCFKPSVMQPEAHTVSALGHFPKERSSWRRVDEYKNRFLGVRFQPILTVWAFLAIAGGIDSLIHIQMHRGFNTCWSSSSSSLLTSVSGTDAAAGSESSTTTIGQ